MTSVSAMAQAATCYGNDIHISTTGGGSTNCSTDVYANMLGQNVANITIASLNGTAYPNGPTTFVGNTAANLVTNVPLGKYVYTLTDANGGTCWGYLTVEDKIKPVCAAVPPPALFAGFPCTTDLGTFKPVGSDKELNKTNGLYDNSLSFRDVLAADFYEHASTVGKLGQGRFIFTASPKTVTIGSVLAGVNFQSITDACGIAEIGYTDQVREGCDLDGQKGRVRVVSRTWYVIDVNGNKNNACPTDFVFLQPTLILLGPGAGTTIGDVAPVIVPVAANVLCNAADAALTPGGAPAVAATATAAAIAAIPGTGWPFFDVNDNTTYEVGVDIPVASNYSGTCMVSASYSDKEIAGCSPKVKKIVRSWLIRNMCSAAATVTGDQLISITPLGPVVTVNDEDKNCEGIQRLVSTDAGDCFASNSTILNATIGTQLCGTSADLDAFISITGMTQNWLCGNAEALAAKRGLVFPINLRGTDSKVPNLPAGEYDVTVTFKNSCGVSSGVVNYQLRVTDNEAPTAIVVDQLVVSLTNNGTTRIYPEQLDKGSRDNCGVSKLEIATVDAAGVMSAFGPYATVDCSNGTIANLALRVTDCATGRGITKSSAGVVNNCDIVALNNTNVAMVPILIQDKSLPQCSAPGDMTMTCLQWEQLKRVAGSGSLVDKEDPAVIAFLSLPTFAGSFGQKTSCTGVAKETYTIDVNACGEGKVVRTYVVTKGAVKSTPCVQTITFKSNKPQDFRASFPTNTTVSCGNLDPAATGKPTITNGACQNIQVSYSDEVFVVKI
jgi:hypothetical protein